MSNDDPYSRFYHRFADEFPNIYEDDRAFSAWGRLLMIADAAWPTRPPVPATVNRKALSVLVGAGLVVVDRGRYTVLGLDKHRSERRANAAVGGRARAERSLSGRSASAKRPLSLTEQRRDETSKDETSRTRATDGLANITDPIATAWEDATGRTILGSGDFAQNYLDDASRRHPEAAVLSAIAEARTDFQTIPSTQALTVAVRSLLDPLPDSRAKAKDDTEERETTRHRRAVENTKRQAHETGWHAEEADPACPMCTAAVVA